jgi:hypothetical protein
MSRRDQPMWSSRHPLKQQLGQADVHKACVYTCLFGDYERLSVQPVAWFSKVPFICFTDNPRLRSRSWTIVPVDPFVPNDPARSSRHPKICAHRYLADYDLSLYIDNSVRLRRTPEAIFRNLFHSQPHKMACMHHSFRTTVREEFEAVRQLAFDPDHVLDAQIAAYEGAGRSLDEKPIWGGFLMRRHKDEDVVRCMERWFQEVSQRSRRDQLSFNYAAEQSGLSFTAHAFEIHKTPFHKWPVSKGRRAR